MDYLKNNICKFTPLFPIDYNKKVDIFSTCFFKMPNRGYKDFTTYINGLKDFDKFIIKRNLNFKLRLFIDESIYSDKELFNTIKKLPNVQPVLYSCPNFIIQDKYHIGLFGTLVRFFPFFDFPNNDARLVVSSDIDNVTISSMLKYLEIMKKEKQLEDLYLFKSGELSKSLYFKHDFMYNNILNPYAVAVSYASFKRINHEVIVNYIDRVKKNKNNEIFSYHYKVKRENPGGTQSENKFNDSYKNFIYGVDEYFLNMVLTPYIIDNKLAFAVRFNWDVFAPLYYIMSVFSDLTGKEINLINYIFEYIYKELDLKLDNNLSAKEKFDALDNILYSSNDENKKYEIYKVFYKMFLYFKNNKLYKFIYPEGFYNLFVDSNLFGTYDINIIKYYNCKYKDIVIKQLKFTNVDTQKLEDFYSKHK